VRNPFKKNGPKMPPSTPKGGKKVATPKVKGKVKLPLNKGKTNGRTLNA
jgi:hypothetical protein